MYVHAQKGTRNSIVYHAGPAAGVQAKIDSSRIDVLVIKGPAYPAPSACVAGIRAEEILTDPGDIENAIEFRRQPGEVRSSAQVQLTPEDGRRWARGGWQHADQVSTTSTEFVQAGHLVRTGIGFEVLEDEFAQSAYVFRGLRKHDGCGGFTEAQPRELNSTPDATEGGKIQIRIEYDVRLDMDDRKIFCLSLQLLDGREPHGGVWPETPTKARSITHVCE